MTGVTFTPPFEHSPFAGIFYYESSPRRFWLLIIFVLVPTLLSCILAISELLRRRWQQLALLAIWLGNLYTVVFLNHDSYGELISCGRIASCVVIAGLMYGIVTRNKLILWSLQYYTLTFVFFLACIWLHVRSVIL